MDEDEVKSTREFKRIIDPEWVIAQIENNTFFVSTTDCQNYNIVVSSTDDRFLTLSDYTNLINVINKSGYRVDTYKCPWKLRRFIKKEGRKAYRALMAESVARDQKHAYDRVQQIKKTITTEKLDKV